MERKISEKVNKFVDKRINTEIKKVKNEVNSAVDSVRKDLGKDIKVVEDKLDPVSKNVVDKSSGDISNNLVIRNLPESENENLNSKVSALLREGLKLARFR